jgi:pentatricopeptide repeat protein
VLNKMPKLGCTPDLISYNTLIDGICKIREIEEAEALLDSMVSKGLHPDIISYTTLVDGLCKKGLIDKSSGISAAHDIQRPSTKCCNL